MLYTDNPVKRSHLQSQNFIRKPQLIKKLVGHSDLKKTDTVYDIGAGSGTISSVLAQYCKHVVAIEVDPHIAPKLKSNLAEFDNVEIIIGDFLKIPLPNAEYKVFANIPFHLSSVILQKLTTAKTPPKSIYLIVQRQFAKKLIIGGDSPFTGMLGAAISPWFETRIRAKLERTDFWPHPAVDTSMIEIKQRQIALIDAGDMVLYQGFVEHCYARQKYFASLPPSLTFGKRPSQLTTEQWVTLYEFSKSA